MAWVLLAVRSTLGSSPLALRLVPVLMGILGTFALLPYVRDRALWSLWWVAIPPLAWLTLFSTPDALLLGAWAVGLAAGIRGGWGWVLAGVAAGLASQAKYSGFALYPLLLCGAGPAVLREPRAWLGLALAVGIAAPNALWVASHDAVTLRFQASEGIWHPRAPGLWGPPLQALGQLVVVTPVSGPTATMQSHQRISPTDTSFGVGKFTLPGGQLQGYLSVQNLRGLVMSVGGGTPQALQAQFDLGTHDAASWYEALCRQQ